MRDTNPSTMSSRFPAHTEKGTTLLFPGKIVVASMITTLLFGFTFIPTTVVRAQRASREDITRISKRTGGPVTPASTRPRAAASPVQEFAQSGPPKKKSIVGSWLETVTVSSEGAPRQVKSLGTYTEDGSVVVADQGNDTTALPFVFSPGHGAWVHLDGRTFAWTVIELVTDPGGNLVARLKIRGQHTVSDSGNEYTGHFRGDLFDPVGNLITSFEGTNQGQRIQVEPLP